MEKRKMRRSGFPPRRQSAYASCVLILCVLIRCVLILCTLILCVHTSPLEKTPKTSVAVLKLCLSLSKTTIFLASRARQELSNELSWSVRRPPERSREWGDEFCCTIFWASESSWEGLPPLPIGVPRYHFSLFP